MSSPTNSQADQSDNICKYSSKPCFNERAFKKTGELHSFCEFHRAMANRNQRRCEQKRRNQRRLERMQALSQQQMQQADYTMLAPKFSMTQLHASPLTVHGDGVFLGGNPLEMYGNFQGSFDDYDVEMLDDCDLEPYEHPVSLHAEDLEYLFMTVMDRKL
ncbi:hypothetical protein Poli38472_007769 [Pythium oligandrum]|uniref:Uncharacterized protein n=1 Tax=Pythium oligandrum TaxID=41045 RepID=A0A8K1CSS8_PYTOL|nr:hypothetical protein Poli38472_007769 [Pythium oligandrum]|eukprot:TMW68097.1 hypothetical protein Poli38472_007769 [Pythium oligandrum]